MTTISTREVLEGLLREIDNADPEMFAPPAEKETGDQHLGVVTDELIRKAFSLSSFYRREAKRLQVDMEALGKGVDNESQFHLLKTKHEVLQELTWYLVRSQFDHWNHGIGLRKGWEVVSIPDDTDKAKITKTVIAASLPGFLRKLLEDED